MAARMRDTAVMLKLPGKSTSIHVRKALQPCAEVNRAIGGGETVTR